MALDRAVAAVEIDPVVEAEIGEFDAEASHQVRGGAVWPAKADITGSGLSRKVWPSIVRTEPPGKGLRQLKPTLAR